MQKRTIVARLSIIDQHIPDIYQNEAIFFECKDSDAAVHALQKGLDETVASIPFLAGEIYENTESANAYVLEWSEGHVRIVIGECDSSQLPSMDELQQRRFPLHLLACDLRPSAAKPTAAPLARKKVFATSFARVEGGIILSHAFHHAFVDGFGLHHIIEKWAAYTSGSGKGMIITPREPLSRVRLDNAVRQARRALMDNNGVRKPTETTTSAPEMLPVPNLPPPVLKSRMKILVFSSQKLQLLGEQLRTHISQPFSQNTLLVGVLWQSISLVRCRRLSTQLNVGSTAAHSEVGMIVDSRRMLEEHLPGSATWLGNGAVALSPRVLFPVSAFSDRIIDGGVHQEDAGSTQTPEVFRFYQSLPRLIKRLASAHSNHDIKQVVSSLGAKLDRVASKDFNLKLLRQSELDLNGLQLIFSSISEMDAYHNFGPEVGRQLAIRTPGHGIDGLCIVLPRKRGAWFTEVQLDELEVQVFLREDDLGDLVKDEVLMQLWGANPI